MHRCGQRAVISYQSHACKCMASLHMKDDRRVMCRDVLLPLPPPPYAYQAQKPEVESLMKDMCSDLFSSRPKDPVDFLLSWLKGYGKPKPEPTLKKVRISAHPEVRGDDEAYHLQACHTSRTGTAGHLRTMHLRLT